MSRPEPRLGNPKNTIEILQKYKFVFQKKFGQNFLIDEHVLDKIISAAGIGSDEDRTWNRDDDSVSGICSARCCCRGDR